jgi:hypothetical protein
MKHRTTLGLIGATCAGAAILAPQALGHPNLNVAPQVACPSPLGSAGPAGAYTPTGIDASGPVRFDWKLTATGQADQGTSATLGQQANGQLQEAGTLPGGFAGTAQVTVRAEGKTYRTPATSLDCRAPEQPPKPPETTPPGAPPPTAPTCEELVARYPKAGPRRRAEWGCPAPPIHVTPPPRRAPVCAKPARLRIVQQQKGTFYTETYPLAVVIRNTTGAATPRGALVLTDTGLQNFVKPGGGRTERLVVPVGPMHKGQVRTVRRRMGFVGVEAFKRVFTTYATLHVRGRVCGLASDRAFEG